MGGYALQSATLCERGLDMDRRWMWVRPNGEFVTQREFPQMVLWTVRLDVQGLLFEKESEGKSILIPFEYSDHRMIVRVWGEEVDAWVMSHPDLLQISSDFLPEAILVFFPESSIRQVDQRYGGAEDHTSFADGFPLLVCNEASLHSLNEFLEEKISIRHFRPNLVVEGVVPYEEDNWTKLKIGEAYIDLVKPCGRCVMINVNPETGEKNPAVLKALASQRTAGNKVLFGMNAISRSNGSLIREGDEINVISVKS